MEHNSLNDVINRTIDFIEYNLKTTITLDDISSSVNMSKFYLNRLFHEISKTTLIRYVKNRKLSSSIFELLNTDFKISDIAAEYGFNYEQSYIRAFENEFSISPDRFRKQKPALNITDKINLDYIKAIGENAVIFAPSIVIIPDFLIAGIKYKINDENDRQFYEANVKGNNFYFKRRFEIENIIHHTVYFGLVEYNAGEDGFSYYMPSVQVSAPGSIPEDMTFRKIPTNKYAIFKYIGLHHVMEININNLYDIFKFIYADWFPMSGYTQSSPYHFEKCDESISREDYCEFELYIPI